MERLVTERRITIPAITRTSFLVVPMGAEGERYASGVFLFRDLAHRIPARMGQVMNAGMEDVSEFMKTLKETRREESVQELLMGFEACSTDYGEAFCELVEFSGKNFGRWGLLVGLVM